MRSENQNLYYAIDLSFSRQIKAKTQRTRKVVCKNL